MSAHWVVHTTGPWKQEITAREARGMIKRAMSGGGVICRELQGGGIIFTTHIVGVEKMGEERYEQLKREDPYFNYLDIQDEDVPWEKDNTTQLVQEMSGEPVQVPAESDYGNEPQEVPTAAMTTDEFKDIFAREDLSQNEFARRIGLSQATVRMHLKGDRPVSEATAIKVREAFE